MINIKIYFNGDQSQSVSSCLPNSIVLSAKDFKTLNLLAGSYVTILTNSVQVKDSVSAYRAWPSSSVKPGNGRVNKIWRSFLGCEGGSKFALQGINNE